MLQVPVILLEFHGEPVEELRVGRLLTLKTKILGGPYDPFAEDPLPDSVDEDAGDERVVT